MKVKNTQKDALESNLTLGQFGHAMSQLNLTDIPRERAAEAIKDHLMQVMANSIRDKEKALEIHISRLLMRK